jgi:hypothetical protein
MSGGSAPDVKVPEPKPVPEEPDILFGEEEEEAKKKKKRAQGTRSLQVPLTTATGGSGLGIPS